MGAPKTEMQKEMNHCARLIQQSNRAMRIFFEEYRRAGGSLGSMEEEILREGMDSVVMLQVVGLMALYPPPGSKRERNLAIATAAFGTAAKYTHVELTRPEVAANIGQVFVTIKQYSQKAIEGKVEQVSAPGHGVSSLHSIEDGDLVEPKGDPAEEYEEAYGVHHGVGDWIGKK